MKSSNPLNKGRMPTSRAAVSWNSLLDSESACEDVPRLRNDQPGSSSGDIMNAVRISRAFKSVRYWNSMSRLPEVSIDDQVISASVEIPKIGMRQPLDAPLMFALNCCLMLWI